MNKWKCKQCGHTYESAGYFSATCPKCRSASATRIDEPIHRVDGSPSYTPVVTYDTPDPAPNTSSDFSGGGGDFGGGGASGDY